MLSEITSRAIVELGPWLWFVGSFLLLAVSIVTGRVAAVSCAIGLMVAGTFAVLSASGVWPDMSKLTQGLIFAGSAIAIFLAIKARSKPA